MRRLLAVLFTLALLAAACGDDSGDAADADTASGDETTTTATAESAETTTTTTEAPTTTAATTTTTEAPASATPEELAAPGDHPVGVTTRTLATGHDVEIWYPAGADAEGQTTSYAVRDFTPQVMKDLVPADLNDLVVIDAGRDASLGDDGPFPLVLFSHGASSFRLQSSVLAHHLASWGMVVASTDHSSRWLGNLLEADPNPTDSVDDVLAMRELVLADDVVGPAIDAERIAMSGHSAGGRTTLGAVAAGGFLGYVSYASGAFEGSALPDVPSLFMAGSIDTIVEPTFTRAAYEAAPSPSWYLEFAASGHLAFSDLCQVGDGTANLITLADAAGLTDFLNDDLRRLGSDGCEVPNRPVTEVWPGFHQATTGFYRWLFGIDDEAIGLDGSATTDVEALSK